MHANVIRTSTEILERIEAIKDADFLGKRREVLLGILDFDDVKPFLIEGATAEDWTADLDPIAEAEEYIDFAVQKIVGQRGLSAGRSVDAYHEYVWLNQPDVIVGLYQNIEYNSYGAPQIRFAAEALGILDAWNAAADKHGRAQIELALAGNYYE